jgi:hypothetical protein
MLKKDKEQKGNNKHIEKSLNNNLFSKKEENNMWKGFE